MMREKRTEKTIFLVRHAEAVGIDQQKRYLGQQDPDLSPLGIHQAEKLGQAFRHRPTEAVFTSDLLRAMHTALWIAKNHGCQPVRVREFREISLGEWEGRTFQEVQAQHPEEYEQRGRDIANYRTPGGESFADLQKRVLPAFTAVVEKTKGNLVIVAHAGVNRVILCHLMRRPLQELLSIPQDHAGVSVLREEVGSYRVVAVNVDSDGLMSCADRQDNNDSQSQQRRSST
jgi:alpha-ribazole phosphatase